MRPRCALLLRLSPFDNQHHTRPEQQREEPAHFAINKDGGHKPADPVGQCLATIGTRRNISPFGHSKAYDVHRQYAHNGKAAQCIQSNMACLAAGFCHDFPPVLEGYYSQLLIWSSGFFMVA